MWLGRAYGLKASHANPVTAFILARRVRDEFERAVQLDPLAPRASSDLCQFYISAPGFAGGDNAKAQAIIVRLEPQFPVYSHRLRALLALENSDYVTAEAEFKNAIVSARGPANAAAAAWIDLARFYRQRRQPGQVLAAIQSGLALSPQDAVLVDAAGILTAAHRSPELAERLLRQYLLSPAQTDEAPAFKVHLQLGSLLAHRRDLAGARAEYNQAITLAPDYEPARKALQSL
jgi:tetratricopeptide (TPR) repeat protein